MRASIRRGVVIALTAGVTVAAGTPASDASGGRWSHGVRDPAGVAVRADGSVVIASSSETGYPGGVLRLRAYARDGAPLWRSAWAPEGGYARARSVATMRGRAFASGVVSPETACDWEIGSFGWFAVGTDRDGRQRWARTMAGWDCAWTSSGPIGAGGDVVAFGITRLIEGYTDVHGEIVALDADGHRRWRNRFEPFHVRGPEGYDADAVTGIAVDGHGRTYAAGWAWSYPREYGADHDGALLALDRHGHRRWVRVLGEPGRPEGDMDMATDVAVRGDHVLLGAVIDRGARLVAKIVMYDAHGATRWTSEFPLKASGTCSCATTVLVSLGPRGAAYVSIAGRGETVLRMLHRGDVEWRRAWPGSVIDLDVDGGRLAVLSPHRLRVRSA